MHGGSSYGSEPDGARGDVGKLDFLEEKVAIVYESKGCDACANGGFKGRTGIYELLDIDEKIRELIHEKSSEQSILKYARSKAPGIREDGKAKVLSGVTSVSEILRVTLPWILTPSIPRTFEVH